VPSDVAYRRAAGRRAYNFRRQFGAAERQIEVARLLRELGFGWGIQSQIAMRLGVHRSTITRDLRKIFPPLDPEVGEGVQCQ